nr:hypothetical protein [Kibdelosporangium sp. MJ126-NF4]
MLFGYGIDLAVIGLCVSGRVHQFGVLFADFAPACCERLRRGGERAKWPWMLCPVGLLAHWA